MSEQAASGPSWARELKFEGADGAPRLFRVEGVVQLSVADDAAALDAGEVEEPKAALVVLAGLDAATGEVRLRARPERLLATGGCEAGCLGRVDGAKCLLHGGA